MPYNIEPKDGQFVVVSDSGEIMGTHPMRGQAIAQQRTLYASVPDATAKEVQVAPVEVIADEPRKPSIIDRVLSIFKEGRRNSSGDEGRLQQIHDLAVANGASCPMVFKEASGRLRWVLFSSNSFQDTDRQFVSQAALDRDVERTDKERNYGPLRWWHVGNPDRLTRTPGDGVDIGDCDFRAMHGRMLIESGTFRNERIGEAIKERADTLAGSIGFFHPLSQPDTDGVFTDIHTFERSLLPRGRASNPLTALTVTKESSDMATMKEKLDEFVALLGGDKQLAESVVKRAEQTEKEAEAVGITSKETEAAPVVEAAPVAEAVTTKEEMAEAEVETETEVDTGAVFDALKEKIGAMIDERLAALGKERTEKEAGLSAQIDALATKLKEADAKLAILNSDLPRGVRNAYRASQDPATINTSATTKEMTAPPNPINDVFNWLASPTPTTPQGQ